METIMWYSGGVSRDVVLLIMSHFGNFGTDSVV